MSELSELLHDQVYPRLDAVEADLLTHFDPLPNKGSRLKYTLTCPECERPRAAFYYPGNTVIHCGRKNNCGAPTRIWNAIQTSTGLDNKALLHRLCELTGTELPGQKNTPQTKGAHSLAESIKRITRDALKAHAPAMAYLTNVRRFSLPEIQQMGLGFYPDDPTVRTALLDANEDLGLAEEWGLVQPVEDREQHKRWPPTGRLVGFWKQSNGSLKLWSRDISTPGQDDGLPKYMFASGLDKTQPYGWNGGSARSPIVVEGTIDKESLQLMGFNALAIGQAGVNANQATFFCERGVLELLHLTDGDRAGHRGAMDTLRNSEPLGITTFFALVPEGMDDVDTLRANGQQETVEALIANAVNGGEFLANQLIMAIDQRTAPQYARTVREIMTLRARLTPASALVFDNTLLRYGIKPVPPATEALRIAANMLELGLPLDAINKRLTALTGMTLPTTD